jgi:hypothetical protein
VKTRKNRDFCGGSIFKTTLIYHSGINHGLVLQKYAAAPAIVMAGLDPAIHRRPPT